MASPPPNSREIQQPRWFMWGIVVGFWLFCFATFYVGWCYWRLRPHLDEHRHHRWSQAAYRHDKILGAFPITNQTFTHNLQHGESIPVRFDTNGFRVPVSDGDRTTGAKRPMLLFLGCSFTHGYGVYAQNTFAEIIASHFGGTALNAGISGGGLSQMVLRARKEIPRQKPDVVVVQDSPWLAERGCTPFVTNLLGTFYITRPYYAKTSERLSIELPPFNAVPLPQRGQKSVREHLLQDWFRILVQFVRGDLQATGFYLQQLFGLRPKPATDLDAVREDGLREIASLCEQNGAQLVIVRIPRPPGEKVDAPTFAAPAGAILIDTQPALLSILSDQTEQGWLQQYAFWRGTPARIVDRHPNALMHRAIAWAVIQGLEDTSESQRGNP